ncbi:hypothetical protein KP509_32G057800 [Ceratopteris richardii]|uniref:P-type ATPase A domain-containing protein n=1 Tax=Ceratopteris richardii TaxID=49495 RepID=A0A8T2QVL3_CERRI|nr:hypothetical protein KP509_32G057800 [Ceratopteris richardii]
MAQDRKKFKVPVPVKQGGRFKITADVLKSLPGNYDLYKECGCLEGIINKIDVCELESGISGSERDIKERTVTFGVNKYDEIPVPVCGFWVFVWEALRNLTLDGLVICAVLSLAVGIPTEGIVTGWYDGVGIIVSILIVVLLSAYSDYRQCPLQELDKEKNEVKVSVIRGGVRMAIYKHEVVVGDILVLSTGDQVAADGIYIHGTSLTIDQSSLTGKSKELYPSAAKPFILSGTVVQYGEGRMLVTAVGMNTKLGNVMAELSKAGHRETPLPVPRNVGATAVRKIVLQFALIGFLVLIIRFLIIRLFLIIRFLCL